MTQRAADREVLVPAQEFGHRDHDRATPAGVGRVHRAFLIGRAVVGEDELVAFLAQLQLHAVRAAIAGPAGLDIGAVLPEAVREARHLLEEGLLRVVDDLLHHALDRARPVATDEFQHAVARGRVARHLRAEVQRHELRLARRTQVHRLDVAPDFTALDDLDRRQHDAFVVGRFGRRAEAAGRDAADVVLVQAVRDPAEELAFPEHRAQQHHVLLVRRADPRVVRQEHVAVADAGVVAAVLQRPLDLRVRHAGHVLHVRAEIDELGVLGQQGRIEIERVHGDRRTREALDGRAVLLVDLPQVVADHLVGDRIDVAIPFAVQLQLRRDAQLFRGDIRIVDAVEVDAGDFTDAWHADTSQTAWASVSMAKLRSASTSTRWPGWTTMEVVVVSMTQGPSIALPGKSR